MASYGIFECATCGIVAERANPPEDAEREYVELFGFPPAPGDARRVCDACYAIFLEVWNASTPEKREAILKEIPRG